MDLFQIYFIMSLIITATITSHLAGGTESSGHLLVDPSRICRKGRRFQDNSKMSMNFIVPGKNSGGGGLGRHRRKVHSFCTKEPEIIKQATRGAQLATSECQFQFRNRHWNCSALPKSIRRILSRDTREAAFVYAITTAGVTYAVTKACSSGHVADCPCDRTMSDLQARHRWQNDFGTESAFEWGGCGDNVHVGYRRSKDILDVRIRRRSDIRSLIILHNFEAGRLAVKENMRLVCKCHGLSGSCTVRTCWQKVPSFREIGERLKVRFDAAAKVIPGNDGKSVIPAVPTIKPPEKEDLIYFDDSQDFCRSNKKIGSFGTHGRQCNSSSIGVDGCDLLCCGRGYVSKVVKVKEYCECTFKWCCQVECKSCTRRKIISTCR